MSASMQYGVTPPVSTTLPTEQENAVNDALIEELKKQNSFESKAETDKRLAAASFRYLVTFD
jgi:poly(A) polymerase